MQLEKINFKNVSSLKVGSEGNLIFISNEKELSEAIDFSKQNNLLIKVIGESSNTYFGQDLSDYLFIKFTNKEIVLNGHFLSVGAGRIFDEVISFSLQNKLFGIENLSAIPGTAGAAPVQNIGAYGVEIKDVFYSAKVYDLKENSFKELKKEDCLFSYRDSIFKIEKDRFIIYEITLKLSPDFNPNLSYTLLDKLKPDLESGILTPEILRQEIINIRGSKLPDYKKFPNCGSFFKNVILKKDDENKINNDTILSKIKNNFPDIKILENDNEYKIPTASLIEFVAEMKGLKIGNFGVSDKHALILINYDGVGDVDELNNFIKIIQDKIFDRVGILIEREVNFVSK